MLIEEDELVDTLDGELVEILLDEELVLIDELDELVLMDELELDSSSSSDTSGGKPAVTYTVFTPLVGL